MEQRKSRWFAEAEVTVQFCDLDPMNVVWHGNYANYLEYARNALLSSIDYSYEQMKESGYTWPIIDLHFRYARPAVFRQRLKILAEIVEWEYKLKIAYLITDAKTGIRLTRATTEQVAVDMQTKEMCFVSPPILFKKLGLPPL